MSIESQADFEGIRRVGRVVAEALRAMERETRADVTTGELDAIGAAVLKHQGARSAPQLFYGCPTTNLISVNDEIVHGLPGARRLRGGDVVKLDVTAELDGYIADAATTVVVPPATAVGERLKECACCSIRGRLSRRARRRPRRAYRARCRRDRQFVRILGDSRVVGPRSRPRDS